MVRSLTRRSVLAGAGGAALAATTEPIRLPRKVRLAILGTVGHTGDVLKALPALPDVEVAAVCGETRDAAERLQRHPRVAAARIYADYREMLEREPLDLVAVCNDNGARAGAILACAARGLHVMAEKPLALRRNDLARIRQAVAARGVKLGMLFTMRAEPSYQALHRLVRDGHIGDVIQMEAQKSYKITNWPQWKSKRSTYGGTMPWIGIHMVDLMRWISGREFVETASFEAHVGFPELGEMENATATIFRLDNTGVATLHMDYLRPETAPSHGDDRLRLAGTKGVAEYQAATGVTVVTTSSKPRTISDLPAPRLLFAEFVEHIFNGKPATIEPEDMFRTTEIVLAAQEAALQHRFVKL